MVRAGKVRLLAVTGKKRFAILPQVPTVSEAGVRGFEVTSWYGLVAPSKTPRPIVDQLNKEIVQILKVSKLQDMFLEDGMELVPTTPAAFNVLIKDEIARWKKLIQTAGLEKVEQ